MSVRLICIDLIDPSPLFKGNDEDNVAQLISDIELHGLHNAVLVYPKPDGRFELIAGHDRVEAMRRLGKTDVPATERKSLSDEQRESVYHRDNLIRKRGDKRAAIEATLIAHTEWSDRRIAEHCGASHTHVQNVRAEMVASGQVATVATSKGEDGKDYPRRQRATGSIVGENGNGKHGDESDMTIATSNGTRSRLRVPDNETAESVVRRAQAEHGNETLHAARAVGMTPLNFGRIAKIIALVDDEHLSDEQKEAAHVALEAVNTGVMAIADAYAMVGDIADAKFGDGSGGGFSYEARFEKRLAKTRNAVVGIVSACDALQFVDIPAGIPAQDRAAWLEELDGAIASLRAFKTHIKDA